MKTCCKCKTEKPLSEFYKNKSKKDGHGTECKQCKKSETRKSYYYDQRDHRQKKKAFLYSLKKPCAICGEPDPVVIDFHHLDPATKSFTLGQTNNYSDEKILAEVDKCVCLCANCHRRVHAGTAEIPAGLSGHNTKG